MPRKKKPPKRPVVSKGSEQNKLFAWVVGQYFAYVDDKEKQGGYPLEWDIWLTSRAQWSPEIKPEALHAEMIKLYGDLVWRQDPARPKAKEDTSEEEQADHSPESIPSPVSTIGARLLP